MDFDVQGVIITIGYNKRLCIEKDTEEEAIDTAEVGILLIKPDQ